MFRVLAREFMRQSSRFAVVTWIVCMGISCAAPATAQEHGRGAEQVQAGYRLYGARCQLCHGPTGEDIASADLTRQKFHTSLTVAIVTNDGRTIRGRRLNEDTFSVQVIDQQENLRSIQKSDIRQYNVSATPNMLLNADELADMSAYLVSLRKH
jgi:mono/diheme cytochrome c family protein